MFGRWKRTPPATETATITRTKRIDPARYVKVDLAAAHAQRMREWGMEPSERSLARYRTGELEIWHLDGVDWMDAELPPWRHACWAQTKGYTGYFNYVERCACGATNLDARRPFWIERNQTRKHQRRERAS